MSQVPPVERTLFDLSPYPLISDGKTRPSTTDRPLWTTAKAQMIADYLRRFVYITRHGTYIDCFAGPQAAAHVEKTWAAKLVLENKPKWLKRFFLFEQDRRKIDLLSALRSEHHETWARKAKRKVEVFPGDCNVEVPKVLKRYVFKPREATFALIDQRTFECSWDLVKQLAFGKPSGNKIELFYFLAHGWMNRAAGKLKSSNQAKLERWWGGSGWAEFVQLPAYRRCEVFSERFRTELGYKSANAFPIRKMADSGRVMFWMIHATDHDQAPRLMLEAYNNTVCKKPLEQESGIDLFGIRAKATNPGIL